MTSNGNGRKSPEMKDYSKLTLWACALFIAVFIGYNIFIRKPISFDFNLPWNNMVFNTLIMLALAILSFGIYVVPSIIGWHNKNVNSVIAVNLFLGWSFIGWVIALVMAYSGKESLNDERKEDKFDKLKKLKTLLDSGAINAAEYETEKQKILRS